MIRSALALSCILRKEFRIHSIRSNRPNPGINNQLRNIFSAFSAVSPKIGEQEVFMMGKFSSPKIRKATTAASCSLKLQCLFPVVTALAHSEEITIEGGTDVSRSPPL